MKGKSVKGKSVKGKGVKRKSVKSVSETHILTMGPAQLTLQTSQ